MINILFLSINIVLVMFVWKRILKPTILDYFRDELFDVREDVREFFIQNKIPLDHYIYKNLRDLINDHLRFTEQMTLGEVISFSNKIEKRRGLKKYIKKRLDKLFKSQDKNLNEYVKKIRSRSSEILLMYMVFSSPFLCFSFFIVGIVSVPIMMLKKFIRDDLNFVLKVVKKTSEILNRYIHVSDEDDLEELSFSKSYFPAV